VLLGQALPGPCGHRTATPPVVGHKTGTFGDDAPIWELDVLRAAARDEGDRRELAQALLDAHGGERQLSQVVPGGSKTVTSPETWTHTHTHTSGSSSSRAANQSRGSELPLD
jgi:hypothetical protein